jgi:4-amino-4-deoxy-L-arabinose transferase-like glycosyltransferase
MQSSSKNKALLLILLAAALLTARWIWIVRDNGDFGVTFEAAARISRGEVFGRDYFISVPPLGYYTEALFVRPLGGSLWSEQINLFLFWLLSLTVGYFLARKLTDYQNLLATGGLMAVIISSPAATSGQGYNYLSTTLSGLAALFYLKHQRNESGWFALTFSGAIAGLGIMAKQNVGLAFVLFLLCFLVFDSVVLSRQSVRAVLSKVFQFGSGLALGFGIPFMALASKSSGSNILQLLFVDGVSGKGGMFRILGRAIPRLGFIDLKGTHYYRVAEIGVSLILMAILIVICIARLRRIAMKSDLKPEPASEDRRIKYWLLITLLCLGFFSAISLLELPVATHFGEMISSALLVKSVGLGLFLGQVAYLVVIVVFGLICAVQLFELGNKYLLKQTAPPEIRSSFFLTSTAAALAVAAVSSSIMYFPFVAPITVPMLVILLNNNFCIPLRRLNLATIVIAGLVYLSPSYTKTFQHYEALPMHSPFAGLYASPPLRKYIETKWTRIHPLIEGRRTLWMVSSGLQSPFGGLTVPNVTSVSFDTHAPRTEATLIKIWNSNLPERVIRETDWLRDPTHLPVNSHWTEPWLSGWLDTNYVKIEEIEGLEVWTKR